MARPNYRKLLSPKLLGLAALSAASFASIPKAHALDYPADPQTVENIGTATATMSQEDWKAFLDAYTHRPSAASGGDIVTFKEANSLTIITNHIFMDDALTAMINTLVKQKGGEMVLSFGVANPIVLDCKMDPTTPFYTPDALCKLVPEPL